jgi:hypothetical protein
MNKLYQYRPKHLLYADAIGGQTVVTWESDPNRSLITPASGTYTENDTWR